MCEEITANDQRSRRCPKLGHPVPFSYCREPGQTLPCGKIADCWWEAFDIAAFLRAHYDEETLQTILAPRQPKLTSIVELIEKARNSAKQD